MGAHMTWTTVDRWILVPTHEEQQVLPDVSRHRSDSKLDYCRQETPSSWTIERHSSMASPNDQDLEKGYPSTRYCCARMVLDGENVHQGWWIVRSHSCSTYRDERECWTWIAARERRSCGILAGPVKWEMFRFFGHVVSNCSSYARKNWHNVLHIRTNIIIPRSLGLGI